MLTRIPDWVFALFAGIFLTIYAGGLTFRYLPSPLELFSDAGVECHQAALPEQQKSKNDQQKSKANAAIDNAANTNQKERNADYEKNVNDCLIAKYTGSLASFSMARLRYFSAGPVWLLASHGRP